MSMTDLFGSDVEESDEEESNSGNANIKEPSAEISGQSGSGESEQSAAEDDNDEDDGEDEEEEDDEEEQKETEVKENNQESDEESNVGHDREEQQDKDEVENHVDEEDEDENSDKEEPSRSDKNVSSMDLFGEDVSSEEDEVQHEKEKEESKSEQEKEVSEVENAEGDQRRPLDSDGEEQDEDKPEEETQINVEIPYSKFSLGSEIAFVKLPNFLSVETKPFVASHYEDEIEEDEVLDEEGRARMKLRVENTIRWRRGKDEDGNEIKESNARVVKWSDGSMSLLLGGEVFDIHKTKIDGEHNHLFVQQGTGLQAHAIFHEKLTFRPHSTNSQTHRKMTLSIADRVSKAGKIKILPVVGKDPESKKGELIKKEEEKLRAQLRRENQQRRMRERSHARGLTASYLEPDRYDDEEDVLEQSLLEMKRQYKKGIAKGKLGEMYSDQESEEGISGGLESDDESVENSTDKKGSFSEDNMSRSRKHSFEEGGSTKKKRKVIESDEDESD